MGCGGGARFRGRSWPQRLGQADPAGAVSAVKGPRPPGPGRSAWPRARRAPGCACRPEHLCCPADEQNYLLRDAEAEVLFSFSLEESLKRAHVSPLFKVRLGPRRRHGRLRGGWQGTWGAGVHGSLPSAARPSAWAAGGPPGCPR